MKHFILYILLIAGTVLSAQTFPVETIRNSGDNDKRINLVILSEGYRASELNQFMTDADNFVNQMLLLSPFKEYQDYFNIYAIKIPSNESGADHPATATDVDESGLTPDFRDTYFNATYDSYGNHRRLFYEIDGNYANNTELKINALLAVNLPEYDQAIIIVNSTEYGGSGGEFPMAYNGHWGAAVTIHELGHSMFDLFDEYYPGDDFANEGINMTQETSPSQVRWKNWVAENGIGIYQHADFDGNLKDWYRPHENCIMRTLFTNAPFCAVCQEGIIEKIHSLISPIDAILPDDNTVDNPTFPLDFQLTLLHPTTNSLNREWTLNGSNFTNDVDAISLVETDLIEGNNTLTVVVHDDSPMLKVDNHNTTHVNTVTWTINYSTLGIDDITNTRNTYTISLFPNPTNAIVNFKIESENAFNIKVSIVSLDGKNIKTLNISDYENNQLNISDLNQGIYVTNFYADNVLIASKKLVKN
ncbi:M64 family metallopeptidase [Algibacter sp. 2305UL17-15]|uniref:M64 family metallopeptidase n=1 Tax=Algibacter sp. 2305UL17-15 TaxID=3231268 RepID=UPI00345A20AD